MCKDITAVSFILQYLKDGTGETIRCFPFWSRSRVPSGYRQSPRQVHPFKYIINMSFTIFASPSLMMRFPSSSWSYPRSIGVRKIPPAETHLNGCIHYFALGMAFFLCKCGHEGKHHLTFGVKGVEPFRFKENTDRMGECEKLPST